MSLASDVFDAICLAGLEGFVPTSKSFNMSFQNSCPTGLVPIGLIQPPLRAKGVSSLVPERSRKILEAIRLNQGLPPIEVDVPPELPMPFQYRVRDGFHRFHLSVGLRFTHIPVVVKPYFDWHNL
jgi:hypothetical protein